MTVALLFSAHREAVRARIGLQVALGELLPQLTARAAEVTAIKAAWLSAERTSGAILAASRASASRRGQIIPFPRRKS